MTDSTELKPCPFCGSKRVSKVKHTPLSGPSVMCRNCYASTTSVQAWNTRTTAAKLRSKS